MAYDNENTDPLYKQMRRQKPDTPKTQLLNK